MKIGITGIGSSKNSIYSAVKKMGYEAELVSYPVEHQLNNELLLMVYDGLYIEEFNERSKDIQGNIIPIFVDVDKIIVLGQKKKTYEEDEVCLSCVLERYKSSFTSNMHKSLFAMKSFAVVDYVLPEEFDIFIYQLMEKIKRNEVVGNILNYFYKYSALFSRKVPGYTRCQDCDQNDYNNQELDNFVRKELGLHVFS
jgi:hypothetical protein